MSSVSLQTLPVELIYHLLEYIDASTIVFSFRYVCKRFCSIVDNYERYKLDFRLISRRDFDSLCLSIDPKNVCTLILSDQCHTPHQIRTFLSKFSFEQFYRLQSLTLVHIEENQLFLVLMHLTSCSLRSLSIEATSWETFSYTSRILLASTIAQSKLERLNLNIAYRDLDLLSDSPLPSTLTSLRLERCTFEEYNLILRQASHLRHFTLNECVMYGSDGSVYPILKTVFATRLTSLSFGPCFMRMKVLLLFLSCTPRLTDLKLIIWTDTTDSVIDGDRWEHFVLQDLPSLKRFEFFFDNLAFLPRQSFQIENYVQAFRTPFWIEEKRWFIACDYIQDLSFVRLYSVPVCNPTLTYYIPSQKISATTFPRTTVDSISNDRVQEITLSFNETTAFDAQLQVDWLSSHERFRRLHQLSLTLDGRYSHDPLALLCKIIDLSSLARLSIQIFAYSSGQQPIFIDHLASILKQTSTLYSLKIIHVHAEEPWMNMERVCATIPSSVKHLQISVGSLEQMKYILEEVHQLISVTFYSTNIAAYKAEMVKWIDSKRRHSLYRHGVCRSQIWLGQSISNEPEKSTKKRVFQLFRNKQAS